MNLPDPQLNRRQLLQFGGIGMLGLGLPQLLSAGAQTSSGRSPKRSAQSCIFIVQYGGCTHLDTFDPKPGAPEGIRGPYKPIATSVPGLRFGELLPRLASLANRCCIVRSMTHGNGGHDGGMHICMTGHSQPTADTPYFGSVMARLRPSTRNIPSYVWLQNLAGDVQPRYLTGGFLGAGYSPLRVGTDLDNPSAPGFRVRAFDPPGDLSQPRLRQRFDLLSSLDSAKSGGMWRFQERAVDLVTGPAARQAFDLDRETPANCATDTANTLWGRTYCSPADSLRRARGLSVSRHGPARQPPSGSATSRPGTCTVMAGLGSMFGKGAFGLG